MFILGLLLAIFCALNVWIDAFLWYFVGTEHLDENWRLLCKKEKWALGFKSLRHEPMKNGEPKYTQIFVEETLKCSNNLYLTLQTWEQPHNAIKKCHDW